MSDPCQRHVAARGGLAVARDGSGRAAPESLLSANVWALLLEMFAVKGVLVTGWPADAPLKTHTRDGVIRPMPNPTPSRPGTGACLKARPPSPAPAASLIAEKPHPRSRHLTILVFTAGRSTSTTSQPVALEILSLLLPETLVESPAAVVVVATSRSAEMLPGRSRQADRHAERRERGTGRLDAHHGPPSDPSGSSA